MTRSGQGSQPKDTRAFARRTFLGGLACAFAIPVEAQNLQEQAPALGVPYVPTPQDVVDQMLALAKPGPDDFVMDLGCGDGRMLVTAAQRFGARGFGVDLNPVRIIEANENARRANVTGKVKFEVRNLFETPIRDASILTMYLLPHINLQLRPRILDDMKPASRIVSHSFSMGDWEPDAVAKVRNHSIYFWIVPAKVEGSWILRDSSKEYRLKIFQHFQKLSGEIASPDGDRFRLAGRIGGDRITLESVLNGSRRTWAGIAIDKTMRGQSGNAWTAFRE